VRIIEPFGEPVVILAEGSNRQLGSHAGLFKSRIGGHKANFIDADALGSCKGGLQLESKFRRFGFAGGKGARKAPKLFFRHAREELHAGETGGREQLGELFFGWGTFQRHAIQQKLRSACSQQQS
jgi:hypothetical protein